MRCKQCGVTKALEEFVKNKECKNGRAGTCKECKNTYIKEWKRKNSVRLSLKRRRKYAETAGAEVKKRQLGREKLHPLRVRSQLLRNGMRNRAKINGSAFDAEVFTVDYIMKRLADNPACECCGITLDIGFPRDGKPHNNSPSMDKFNPAGGYTKTNTSILCWRCNNLKRDASIQELQIIVKYMETWTA